MHTIARGNCLRLREFLVLEENLMRFTLRLVCRFPNPVPPGTRVPQWALLDVTVSY